MGTNVVRRTISLSLQADKILVEIAKGGMKISTVIEKLIMEARKK